MVRIAGLSLSSENKVRILDLFGKVKYGQDSQNLPFFSYPCSRNKYLQILLNICMTDRHESWNPIESKIVNGKHD